MSFSPSAGSRWCVCGMDEPLRQPRVGATWSGLDTMRVRGLLAAVLVVATDELFARDGAGSLLAVSVIVVVASLVVGR